MNPGTYDLTMTWENAGTSITLRRTVYIYGPALPYAVPFNPWTIVALAAALIIVASYRLG